MQPAGYVHSLGFLDQARYLRYQFRRFGAQVSIAKNRLREDAVNFVFGAHLGFPADAQKRHACIFVNLEQLGQSGAQVGSDYLNLLRYGAVIDYDAANVATYAQDAADVPLISFLHAPYLDDRLAPPLEERPIDLLFFGSMNPRRQAFLAKVEATGAQVSRFDHPIYGAERDEFIRQAKAVLNCHFYDTSRFEQARAFQCLSLGTPMISERGDATRAPSGFDDAVFWLEGGDVAPFFAQQFGSVGFFDAARAKLKHFRHQDPMEAYADVLAFAAGYHRTVARKTSLAVWQPRQIANLSREGYRAGWLNVCAGDDAEADLALDLAQPLALPAQFTTQSRGIVLLEPGSASLLQLDAEGIAPAQCQTVLRNALALLEVGGVLKISTPVDGAADAPEPDGAWLRHAAEFWRYGELEHRFAVHEHLREQPRAGGGGHARAHLDLKKTALTIRERTLARADRADFGGLPDDLTGNLPASDAVKAARAAAEGAVSALTTAGIAPVHTPQTAPADLTVVCVSYKRYDNIPILIHSFLTQTLQSYKLLIIHDGHDAKMEAILAHYKQEHPDKIDYRFTERRYNDYGHSLRDIGIKLADTEYILITNDDNYYCPRFVELMVPEMKATGADIALCNMIHSHDRPGMRPQASYMPFETRPARGSVDIGSFIARTAWADRVGFRDKSHDGDATYFEDLLRCAEQPKVLKVERTLFVHN